MTFPKVLVGSPINERKAYCMDDYLTHCCNLTYPNKKFYFVDNSENRDWHVDNVIAKGFDCDYVNPKGRTNQQYICISQNAIRQKAIEENFDFLLFIECDIFPKKNIIEEMISYDEKVVACNYFIGQRENSHLLKTEIEKTTFGNYTNRNINDAEGFLDYVGNKKRSSMFGFGCCLIRRDVFTKFRFHVNSYDRSHADTPFYFDLWEAGIEPICHPEIVRHMNSSWKKVLDT